MEKENMFVNERNTLTPTWSSSNFGMEIQTNELNCTSDQLTNHFFNPNWDNTVDQNDPFESALSSMVSSPVTSNASGDGIVLRELIGRLGSICNSGEISPPSYFAGNNSTNTSCYSTPLNSPPKLNLSMMDHQIGGNLQIPGNQFPNHPSLTPFCSDPGFVERAARFSCFGSRNFGVPSGQIGLNESEFPHKLMNSSNLSRLSRNQSFKVTASPMGAQENREGLLDGKISASDDKFSVFSRSSTPKNGELGDSREESSVSEQIPGGEIGSKTQNDASSRKRKSIPREKPKEISSSSAKNAKAGAENDESNSKRNKPEEGNGNEKEAEKSKADDNGTEKQSKDNQKPAEPPKDYIHVRARRGQATDSHSLAERVRREKISERMKFLQDLVPGCNKVTGKAVMLDEIINYVQSLQRQVEFLSMKLSTVNTRMDFNMEALLSKESHGSLPHSTDQFDSSSQALPYALQSHQGSNLHCAIPNGSENPFSLNPLNSTMHRNPGMQLPPINCFGEPTSQASTFWEDDLQSLVQMGFGQNQSNNLQGTTAITRMKVEL
ncbi:unnamed protein product [Ilex paraguariensis]|uniref:BHLH domain-containing protein n=1 Tax=Ilex paraguariensis TaxID=185542 RepID=A0ABC8R412_9AQUA